MGGGLERVEGVCAGRARAAHGDSERALDLGLPLSARRPLPLGGLAAVLGRGLEGPEPEGRVGKAADLGLASDMELRVVLGAKVGVKRGGRASETSQRLPRRER